MLTVKTKHTSNVIVRGVYETEIYVRNKSYVYIRINDEVIIMISMPVDHMKPNKTKGGEGLIKVFKATYTRIIVNLL